MSTLSTHILDISTGKPAQGVTVNLEREGEIMATGVTNANGRITEFVPFLPAGRYRLVAAASALEPLVRAASELKRRTRWLARSLTKSLPEGGW